jgi:uncharacterized protein YktA (UPF0223 family)
VSDSTGKLLNSRLRAPLNAEIQNTEIEKI